MPSRSFFTRSPLFPLWRTTMSMKKGLTFQEYFMIGNARLCPTVRVPSRKNISEVPHFKMNCFESIFSRTITRMVTKCFRWWQELPFLCRLCEICGQTAKNITGITDNRFMEEWNNRILSGYGIRSSERSGGCWRGQPFCNFLMACLVIAFVLPWFFRVNMF